MTQRTGSATNGSNRSAAARARSSSNGTGPSGKRGTSARGAKKSGSSAQSRKSRSDHVELSERLKTSAIAGGAAAAGVVGGLALARRGKVFGLRLPGGANSSLTKSLADAAKEVGGFGERLGELANEVRLVREGVAHSHERSPVEVLLEGLTTRRKR